MHADHGKADEAATHEARLARTIGGDGQAYGGKKDRYEEGAAGQRRIIGDADVRLEGEERHEVRGPHDRAGGEPGKEYPAAAPLPMHLTRLRKEEQRDEASQGADPCKLHKLGL